MPSPGAMLHLGITPPDPGSVVELDSLEDELGKLPAFGDGLVPTAHAGQPG
ncbi:hypothetical protein [Streptomyces sp. NPDC049879]|uniref:hypothetical protein n=1 Tax=Streptomyces sp. NPDC049879 TaxID=3365598 RepID=UPI0037A5EE0E